MSDELKVAFGAKIHKIREHQEAAKDNLSEWEIVRLARELNMTEEDLRMAKLAFRNFDVDGNGSWESGEFEKAIGHLLHRQQANAKTVKTQVWRQIWGGSKDTSVGITFRQFLVWYSSNRFQRGMLLSEEQQLCHRLAVRHGVTADEVEHVKSSYDNFDKDHSGNLDYQEFKKVLAALMRVPAGTEIPDCHTQRFWREADQDRSGEIVFEEFLAWWIRQRRGLSCYEDFYKQIRNVARPDPPAYGSTGTASSGGWTAFSSGVQDAAAAPQVVAQHLAPSLPLGQRRSGIRRPLLLAQHATP